MFFIIVDKEKKAEESLHLTLKKKGYENSNSIRPCRSWV